MGEIKSTLDLVLEKTKNLTLSAEEKKEQEQNDIENRIKGMMQKYQDGILSYSQLMTDYNILKKEYDMTRDDALVIEIIGRIEPDQDNQALLQLLQECCNLDTAAIESFIESFRQAYITASQNRLERLKKDLAQYYNISGSAVLPNLSVNEQWLQEIREMRAGFDTQINQLKDKLLGGSS